MLLDLKKRLEISHSHFLPTCLKCDNRVSGVETQGGEAMGQKTQCASLEKWMVDRMTCRWLHLQLKRMQYFWKRALLFFSNCKENERKMLIVAARKYAWESGLYHLLLK